MSDVNSPLAKGKAGEFSADRVVRVTPRYRTAKECLFRFIEAIHTVAEQLRADG